MMKFTEDFRRKAVELTNADGMTVDKVAAQLGCSTASLHVWRRKARLWLPKPEMLPPPPSPSSSNLSSFNSLKTENSRLKAEVRILKEVIRALAGGASDGLADLLSSREIN